MLLQIGAARLLQIGEIVITNRGRYYKSDRFITNWGRYYKSGRFITNRGRYYKSGIFITNRGRYYKSGRFITNRGRYYKSGQNRTQRVKWVFLRFSIVYFPSKSNNKFSFTSGFLLSFSFSYDIGYRHPTNKDSLYKNL